jgi:hypothetical protein
MSRLKNFVTIAVLVITFAALAAKQKGWDLRQEVRAVFRAAPLQTPEDRIYKMLDAARAGDTNAYLDCFSGEMRQQLSQVIKETSAVQFSRYLVAQNLAFTGVAVSVAQKPDPDSARLRVEYVYSGRNEVQEVSLLKDDGKWRISKIASSERIATLIPYGTRVTD